MSATQSSSIITPITTNKAVGCPVEQTTWQRFSIDYQYPVTFTDDLFNSANPTLLNTVLLAGDVKQHRLTVFIDEGVSAVCPTLLQTLSSYIDVHSKHLALAGAPTVVASGENIKSDPSRLDKLRKIVADQHIDRHSFIIGIGGGALLDAIGLVAATSHRGIRHIRIPTTVLSQNDSGVGVKNGVNRFGQKNYLGTFAPPFAVINDSNFIRSLPDRDKVAGMSEAVKVALIRDARFYHWLEDNATALARFESSAMQHMIRRCAELHMQQIAQGGDPFEYGSARPLDFGHWAAHRLELLTGHKIRHGEAVAIGIALDVRYSVLAGLLEKETDSRICSLLESLGFTLWHPELEKCSTSSRSDLIQGLADFREHLGGELTITLLQQIGVGIEVNTMNYQRIEQSIGWLEARQAKHSADIIPFTRAPIEAKDVSAKNANTVDSLNSDHVAEHLQAWLDARLSKKDLDWLQGRLQLLQNSQPDRDLYITLGLIPRKLGRNELKLTPQDIGRAQKACGRAWNPVDWTVDVAARCLIIVKLQQQHPDEFDTLFAELCKTADLQEAMAFYRSTAVLPDSLALGDVMGAGLRTHIRAIFDTIALNNPYPQLHFDENRWNHMILKTLFIDSVLWPIQGIDERANPELAAILCDYAHERWAANRPVTPELWRCVGPFAKGTMLDDLLRILNPPEQRAESRQSKQAALLALYACPAADQKKLRAQHPSWYAMIDSGKLNWNSIGQHSQRL